MSHDLSITNAQAEARAALAQIEALTRRPDLGRGLDGCGHAALAVLPHAPIRACSGQC